MTIGENMYLNKLYEILSDCNGIFHKIITTKPKNVKLDTCKKYISSVNEKKPKFRIVKQERISS